MPVTIQVYRFCCKYDNSKNSIMAKKNPSISLCTRKSYSNNVLNGYLTTIITNVRTSCIFAKEIHPLNVFTHLYMNEHLARKESYIVCHKKQ